MLKKALFVKLEAKEGKEKEVEDFLRNGLALVDQEPDTITWHALKMGPSTFGIFDTFEGEDGRQAHLNGKVAAALKEKASELFSKAPVIEKIDLIESKFPFLVDVG